MTPPLLAIDDLALARGGNMVLRGFSASLEAGETVAVIGANGAGKSSLLRAVMGFRRPEAGSIRLAGEALESMVPRRRAALGIGYCPEGRRLFPGLTVEENLQVAFRGSAADRRARVEEMLAAFPALHEKRSDRAWSLSGGQQQMLAIGRAIMNRPRLVLLDEPTLGLAPMVIAEVLGAVRAINTAGAGVILAEQNVEPALRVADTALVLVRGTVVHAGPAANLDPARAAGLLLTGAPVS